MAIEDSPFVGSRQFGLAFVNSEGGLAAVGEFFTLYYVAIYNQKINIARSVVDGLHSC